MDDLEKRLMQYGAEHGGDGWAVVQMLMDIRAADRAEYAKAEKAAEATAKMKRTVAILVVIALALCLVTVSVFAVLASGIQIEHTTTTTTTTETITQDTGEGSGNNIYQAGEGSQYIEGSGE